MPGHFHTAIDLQRPNDTYEENPIFAIGTGVVISMRSDGPYAQIILSHGDSVFSVYEHLSGIRVVSGDSVTSATTLGRFMNRDELNRLGWQFDHLHLEIMKKKPQPRAPILGQSHLHFRTYALVCYTPDQLEENYYNPTEFFLMMWQREEESRQVLAP